MDYKEKACCNRGESCQNRGCQWVKESLEFLLRLKAYSAS